MHSLYRYIVVLIPLLLFSQQGEFFHDTRGSIEVTGLGQLQYTLPISLPPGVKSVAPQISLAYTSGSGNGLVGYGWNITGITAISRIGLNEDGVHKSIDFTSEDAYFFNGQRLVLKSGEYGKDGAIYATQKYSNVRIKAVGSRSDKQGPDYWEVSFEDGSQAWYGVGESAKTPIEYNITKWQDAQGNYISYEYTQQQNVSVISSIKWGGNEHQQKPHFNHMIFHYAQRDLLESSFFAGQKLVQEKMLAWVQVNANGSQFKKYVMDYDTQNKYPFVKNITEFNSKNEPSNPIAFGYEPTQDT